MNSEKNVKIKKVINELKNSKRFFQIRSEKKIWFYDSYSHALYSLEKNIFDELESNKITITEFLQNNDLETCVKVLNFFSTIERIKEDKIPQIIQDRKCNVMINTSNRCNLNCSYCYRDKKNSNVISISTIDKIFKFIKTKYRPEADEYIISYSMTSESSLDLPILKQIADKYINYENYLFIKKDFYKELFIQFYKRLSSDLFDKIETRIKLPSQDVNSVILFLNQVLGFDDLYELLNMNESMFDQSMLDDVKKRKILSKWRLYRLNRWCLEISYAQYLKKRRIPYVCFWFMTNGTCASKEYIDFIKACNINPLWVSIDGPKEIHDANRMFNTDKPSYDYIVKNIKIFIENQISLKASVVLTSDYPEPLKIIKHLLGLGFTSFSITPIRPGAKNSFTEENVSTLFEGYDKLFDKLKDDSLKQEFMLFRMLQEDLSLAAFNFFIARTKQLKRCSFDNQIVIDSKGNIYPCLYFVNNENFCYGNINGDFNEQVIKHNSIITSRKDCKDCWSRYLCGGTCFYGSYKSTDNHLDIDPIECMIRKYMAKKCLELLIFMREHNINIYQIY